MRPARQSLVVLLTAGAWGLLGACGQSTASTEVAPADSAVQQPATETPSAGDPVIGPPAVRVVQMSAKRELRLSVVGPANSKYRVRLGKDSIDCRQTNGHKAARALPGMPPNSLYPVTLNCPGQRASAGKGVLLVTTTMPEGFSYDYEVALDRDS